MPWNTTLLCESLRLPGKQKARNILFVGDSVTTEGFFSMVALAGSTQDHQLTDYEEAFACPYAGPRMFGRYSMQMSLCRGILPHPVCVRTARCDDLGFPTGAEFYANWQEDQFLAQFDVVVMNMGAHWIPDNRFNASMYAIANVVKRQRMGRPHARFFWRSTIPGHANCSGRSQPILGSSAKSPPVVSPHPGWHWEDIPPQNTLAAQILGPVGVEILDVYEASIRRPDRHQFEGGDCLHYHLPSVIDYWNILLFNFLVNHAGNA
jgi:hypothetical protein